MRDSAALTRLVRTATDKELQALVLAKKLSMFYFIASCDQLFVGDRMDKIPAITVKWSHNHLINYADLVLQKLRDTARLPCAPLPDIRQLLAYDHTEALLREKLLHPRHVNIFLSRLFNELNGLVNATNVAAYHAAPPGLVRRVLDEYTKSDEYLKC